jgi:hypothetical protein
MEFEGGGALDGAREVTVGDREQRLERPLNACLAVLVGGRAFRPSSVRSLAAAEQTLSRRVSVPQPCTSIVL